MTSALPTTPTEALAFLQQINPSGIELGLSRMQAVLAALGHPEQKLAVLHVAGTNGKGSTCAFAESLLRASGFRVGLFTSPHLVRVNERIQINREEISDLHLGERLLEVFARCPQAAQTLTYFELGTVLAFWHFAREQVDAVVLETGLGGRLDATSTASPWVTAITPISFDHMDYLGSTLDLIAVEKAGILKPQVPLVLSRQAAPARAAILEVASRVGAPVWEEGRDFELTREGQGFCYRQGSKKMEGFQLGLRGSHQLQNAAVAMAMVSRWSERKQPLNPQALREGLAHTRWPGRLEELPGRPPVLLDGAHNPAGVEVLLRALDELYPGRRVHVVFGVVADKDHGPMMDALFPRCASLHLCPLPTPRTLAPADYVARAEALNPQVRVYRDEVAAYQGAQSLASPEDLVLCTGSLFLVGALRANILAALGAMQQ